MLFCTAPPSFLLARRLSVDFCRPDLRQFRCGCVFCRPFFFFADSLEQNDARQDQRAAGDLRQAHFFLKDEPAENGSDEGIQGREEPRFFRRRVALGDGLEGKAENRADEGQDQNDFPFNRLCRQDGSFKKNGADTGKAGENAKLHDAEDQRVRLAGERVGRQQPDGIEERSAEADSFAEGKLKRRAAEREQGDTAENGERTSSRQFVGEPAMPQRSQQKNPDDGRIFQKGGRRGIDHRQADQFARHAGREKTAHDNGVVQYLPG